MMQVTIVGLKKKQRQQRPPQQLRQWYVQRNETKTAVSLSAKKTKKKKHAKGPEKTATTKDHGIFFPLVEDKNPFHAIQRSQWSCCIFVLRLCHPTSRRAYVSLHNGSRQSRSPFKQRLPQSSWTCLLRARLEKYHRRKGREKKKSKNGTKRHFQLIIQVTLENGLFHCRFKGPMSNIWRKLLAWNRIEDACVYF